MRPRGRAFPKKMILVLTSIYPLPFRGRGRNDEVSSSLNSSFAVSGFQGSRRPFRPAFPLASVRSGKEIYYSVALPVSRTFFDLAESFPQVKPNALNR